MATDQSQSLTGKTVGFVMANEGVEEVELTRPWEAVRAAGGEPVLVATNPGEVQAVNHLDKADIFHVDRTTSEVEASDFDALVLPGGVANPDELRTDPAAVRLVQEFIETGRPIAAICHGPWTLVEAGVLKGRTLTSWPSLRTDIRNAGGTWVDEQLVIDDNLISSRRPDDLEAFSSALVEQVAAS
ncbi:MAG: intracellular protease, PfpI family [Acidimicrobiaceae bacterium]|nr:intracellular protease, PfpI family [Acidimicrobiaceae bacterium]